MNELVQRLTKEQEIEASLRPEGTAGSARTSYLSRNMSLL
jgi:hypothetical protein